MYDVSASISVCTFANPVKHIKESLDSHSSFFRTDKSSRLSSIFDFLPQKATKQHNQAFMNRSLALKMKDRQIFLSNIVPLYFGMQICENLFI